MKTRLIIFLFLAIPAAAARQNAVRIPGPGAPVVVIAPPTGMLIWYRGDSLACTSGCSGTNAVTEFVDKSGNGNNATDADPGTGTGNYVASADGGLPGVLFNGSSSGYSYAAINLASGLTVCAVVKNTAASSAAALLGGYGGSFEYYTSASKEQNAYAVGGSAIGTGTAAADTSYHSICVTYDGTTVKFYIDGSADGSATPSVAVTGDNVTLGYNSPGSDGQYFNGTLMDLVVYSSVLPATGSNSIATWFTYTSGRY